MNNRVSSKSSLPNVVMSMQSVFLLSTMILTVSSSASSDTAMTRIVPPRSAFAAPVIESRHRRDEGRLSTLTHQSRRSTSNQVVSKSGFDVSGFDVSGLDGSGLDVSGLDGSGLDGSMRLGRRGVLGLGLAAALVPWGASAQVFFDPAMYGDQELRVGAVDSVKESVRRAILQNPQLAPSFYQLALLDGLSYNAATKQFGPDGSIVKAILSAKKGENGEVDEYMTNLQLASLALLETEQRLRKKVQISLADAIAIAGAESIESVGGPYLTVQLGRPDTPPGTRTVANSPVPVDLFSGRRSSDEVRAAFTNAGLTERETTALLGGLFTLERVEKSRTSADWRQSAKPKFREPGKIGRMSEFRPLTDDDIQQALTADDDDGEDEVDPDDGWYIADSFGTKEDRFGQRLAKDEINEKNFNKYLKELITIGTGSSTSKSNKSNSIDSIVNDYWTASLLLDDNYPTTATWLNKYAGANLNFLKDLNIAYNSVTQLGAVYTGGKYEQLLNNKKGTSTRKSLNDDDLKLF